MGSQKAHWSAVAVSRVYPELTLVELLQMFAAMYDVPVDPMDMLHKVNLEDKAKKLCK